MSAKKKPYCYEYPRPAVTVDVVIVTRGRNPKVLLIRRKNEPFAGCWAIPGGFVDMDEPLEAAARRELQEETGVAVTDLEQLHTFGDPGRDPRGRVIAVAFLARIDPSVVKPQAGSDAAGVAWHPLKELPPLAFDHADILASARERMRKQRSPVK